jgi:hypothetical protein
MMSDPVKKMCIECGGLFDDDDVELINNANDHACGDCMAKAKRRSLPYFIDHVSGRRVLWE